VHAVVHGMEFNNTQFYVSKRYAKG